MKTINEIYEELLTAFAKRAGYTPDRSCDLAIRLYAVAAQLQALSLQADWVLDQSFPQTAHGKSLDYHAAMRGLSRMPATQAEGILQFSVSAPPITDLTISMGTVCMTPGMVQFETTETVMLLAGHTTVQAKARAVEAGVSGNVAEDTITVLSACPIGITGCINPTVFKGGSDEESDEQLRARILESYQRLPNGANAMFYEQSAMRHPGVSSASAVGRARGIGTVDVFVATEAGVPSQELLQDIQDDLQKKREIAVDVRVLAPTLLAVDIKAEIASADNADFDKVKAEAELAIAGCFDGRRLGAPVRVAELYAKLYSIEGVENCHILSPSSDVAGGSSVLPTLGKLNITRMEGK